MYICIRYAMKSFIMDLFGRNLVVCRASLIYLYKIRDISFIMDLFGELCWFQSRSNIYLYKIRDKIFL